MNIFDNIESAKSKIELKKPEAGVSITFSNTGTRGKNWFTLTFSQLRTTLKDIRDNIDVFRDNGAETYKEKTWRDLLPKYATDDTIRTMSTVQTFPLFTLLSLIIYYANRNDKDITYVDKHISLDEAALLNAENCLKAYIDSHVRESRLRSDVATSKTGILRKTGGINRIYYGAPGTGKSYTVEKSSSPETRTTTVFHSDFQNSDFVGALKPVMSDGSVTYKFSPGPFAIALKEAWLDPENMHYLVIEELNRAPAASVFGELFQLLDRDNNGNSQYEIDFPSEEFASWWEKETGEEGKMKLPSNLSILATMNSADQGVYPLDTAFRRRWEHKYIPLDYKKAPEGQIGLRLKDDETPRPVEWSVFLKRLNQYLVEKINDLPEDRLIGPYFLSGYDLDNAKNSIPEKLLIYIWDDLLRHTGRQEIFVSSIKTYGDLVRRNENGKVIFSEAFLARFDDGNGVVS